MNMDSKSLTTHSQLFSNLGLKKKKVFSRHVSWFCFPFSSDEQEPLIYNSLSLCLQTHRELDGIADSERRRYGALHWTTETVSVDAVNWQGIREDRCSHRHFTVFFRPTVFQIWSQIKPVPLLMPSFYEFPLCRGQLVS